ncbi:SusD/RagB family nutrient-binding outer membrane lipoprotein [Niabella ginsengisoli]|uniref:SusD/RagB family nutrient-binding outer membrane lipoprotein n=1 Tax=Niabella ginsengisoli TaxID=522298 RepID=A0ABS9SGZ2_9BACT|nr:SusD/RagB family nutrient-binding outer membrane lipoprotein [Niabella ginsengisoli]MCH5597617.1 SusD/RagB family nutrient-binding outer membrane lipoprotein [Niabella ginsengisoli]
MKYIYSSTIIIASICLCCSSCKRNFGEINTNPQVVTTPDLNLLLPYTQDKIVTYQKTEWVWEGFEQLLRFTQHISTDPYEITSNVNSRYLTYYQQILPNLFEIRRQIDMKTDKDSYQKMAAITYVLQILHGIKVTDMNGSIVYKDANLGRYEQNFNPTYDKQEDLFNTWLQELNNAIAILTNTTLPDQNTYGSGDVMYANDWIKWAKLANSLKLRIAARLENQDVNKTKAIFQEIMQSAAGAITTDDEQLSYQNNDYIGAGDDINYRSTRYGTTSIINFLKRTNDPRLLIYFEKNGLAGNYRDTLTKYNTALPAFINPNDPLINYQGGPADFTTNSAVAAYIKNPFLVGNTNAGNSVSRYFLISPINRKFFSPRYQTPTSTAQYKEVIFSAAEVCFLIAEFIQKGYAGSANTSGTAEDWYNKGIASSIKTMNAIAVSAESTTAYTSNDAGNALITAYQNNVNVKFNGVNNLERIYIQQYLNFYRNANEAFVFCRRTGYPKTHPRTTPVSHSMNLYPEGFGQSTPAN